MTVSSTVLNSHRILYPGSFDGNDKPEIPEIVPICLHLLMDYLHHENSKSTSFARALYHQYDHIHHTSDSDAIACVAHMLRNNTKSNQPFSNHVDEKRFYHERLGDRQIGQTDIKRNVTTEARTKQRNIIAR